MLTEAGWQRHAEAAPAHRDVLAGLLSGPILAQADAHWAAMP